MGYEEFVDTFLGPPQNWPIFRGSFLCMLGSFLKGKVQNVGYFMGLLKFQTFLLVLEIPDIFFFLGGGCTVDAGPEPAYTEKKEYAYPLGMS